MAGLYVVVSWLVVQVVGALAPMFGAPEWVARTVVLLLAVGFLPALLFAWVYEITPEGLKRESEIDRHESITPDTGRRMDRAILALLVLAVGIFAVDRFVLAPKRATTASTAAAEQATSGNAPAAISEKSIAVLPLANGSDDKEQQYFSDGLSENLIIALSQFAGLKVIGRNSSFQFRDTKEDSKSIGAKLGVAHLLEGSVQRAGDVVRISAELISAADGSTLWSQRYDRPYQDLFKLQDEITGAVADALKARLLASSAGPAQSDRPPSGNLEAYNAYLQSNFYRARGDEENLRKAIGQLESATRLDPRYAMAWAELSRAWLGLAVQHLGGERKRDALDHARTAVTAALQLDADLAAAHWARGSLLLSGDFSWADAEAEFRRVEQLLPNDGRAKYELGAAVSSLGRPDEAVRLTRAGLATDPLNARWWNWLSGYQVAVGDMDGARQSLAKSIELQPNAVTRHFNLAVIEIMSGNPAAALAAAEREPTGIWHDLAIALARQAASDRAAADAALKLVVDKYGDQSAYQVAEYYAVRREPDKMFEWLDRTWTERDPGLQNLLYDPLLLHYRDDPRFAAFCRKVGLPTTTTAKVQPIPEPKAGKA